jgi:hypothetical protein
VADEADQRRRHAVDRAHALQMRHMEEALAAHPGKRGASGVDLGEVAAAETGSDAEFEYDDVVGGGCGLDDEEGDGGSRGRTRGKVVGAATPTVHSGSGVHGKAATGTVTEARGGGARGGGAQRGVASRGRGRGRTGGSVGGARRRKVQSVYDDEDYCDGVNDDDSEGAEDGGGRRDYEEKNERGDGGDFAGDGEYGDRRPVRKGKAGGVIMHAVAATLKRAGDNHVHGVTQGE